MIRYAVAVPVAIVAGSAFALGLAGLSVLGWLLEERK